jgi:3-methylcrotonyl-CoA carboxylase alpha subunit
MIRSVLIANRGEIALRVMRTCERLGIRTVAIYSDADREALHVRQADEAYRVGPPAALESYLNQAAILDAARSSRVEAIHPGYGFLSENADFADAVLAAGLVWIGPPPAAMRLLGEKAPAKALAERLGVPVLPGYHGEDQSSRTLAEQADRIGYPLLIKASAGGGGRGMRLVESGDDFAAALESAQREAQSSFGNNQVLLEKYVLCPRHVEVQIFGDAHGNVIHLGERECSIQRRNQKLVEETPSPAIDSELRARMGAAAVTLAKAAGYENAGTVELILDQSGNFYFLELNARLQVEHPVTEMVTGLDLVQLQLQVADGQPLPLSQEEVRMRGHAIETRVIAEDPLSGFLPSTGVITTWSFPEPIEGLVRLDAGFELGGEVTPYYDSLLAKLIVWAEDRARAVERLRGALAGSSIAGPKTNLDLLLAIAEHRAFQRGDLHTRFLEEHQLVAALLEQPPEVLAAASAIFAAGPRAASAVADPWRDRSGWRPAGAPRIVRWQRADEISACSVLVSPSGPVEVTSGDRSIPVDVLTDEAASVSGAMVHISTAADGRFLVRWHHRTFHLTLAAPPDVGRASSLNTATDGRVTAPMPGRIVKLYAKPGQAVSEHQPLLVLESMKIEHVVTSPLAGTISKLEVSEGEQVVAGAVLAEIESTQ